MASPNSTTCISFLSSNNHQIMSSTYSLSFPGNIVFTKRHSNTLDIHILPLTPPTPPKKKIKTTLPTENHSKRCHQVRKHCPSYPVSLLCHTWQTYFKKHNGIEFLQIDVQTKYFLRLSSQYIQINFKKKMGKCICLTE